MATFRGDTTQTGLKKHLACATTIVMTAILLLAANGYSAERLELRVVETSNVCMVNDKDMGKPQLPVPVGGKVYYGCCKMCVGNINNNEKARYSVDPATGKKVDKAAALIAAKPNGDVLYFESEKSFKAFQLK